MKKQKKIKTNLELMKSIRGTWGNTNPCTKVIESKKCYRRHEKHKKDYARENYPA